MSDSVDEKRIVPAFSRRRERRSVMFTRLSRRTRRLVFGLTVALISAGLVVGSVAALRWMETPEFCSLCHTMKPQFLAYERSPHRSVECAQCHIGNGVMDLVKAKMDGTVQLAHLITGTFQRPIPPAGHLMAQGAQNCQVCHKEPPADQDRLVVRRSFQEDEKNTEQLLALVVKLAEVNGGRGRGIHWHVKSSIEFLPRDAEEHQIDYVRVSEPSGQVREYVSQELKRQWASNEDLLGPVKAADHLERMDCLNCHNRVGHDFLSPSRALDMAMSAGTIDKTIPAIKKRGTEALAREYASSEEAYAAIGQLEDDYRQAYPAVYDQKREAIRTAVEVLREVYGQVASPEMQASYQTYQSFLGHRDTSGCFRCHDGTHFLLDQGKPTNTVIPANCSLCHTFPQRGDAIRNIMVGAPPTTHSAKRWVVEHQLESGSLDVAKTSCGACHSQSYCSNCHALGITHANMRFDHAAIMREKGPGTCTYCHQQPFCARCHTTDVLRTEPT